MSDPPARTSPAWLVVPAFVYVFGLILVALRQIDGWTVLGAALTALPLVTCLPARGSLVPWAGPAAALVVGFLIGVPVGFASGSTGMAVFGGVALASPVAGAAAIVRWRHDAALVLPLTFAGFVDLLTLRAALDRLAGSTAPAAPGGFALTVGQVTWDQFAAIGSLLLGSRTALPPLQGVTDAVFALLLLLAIVGAFLALFLPEPIEGDPGASDPLAVLVPVLVAVLCIAVFELAAARIPTYALLGLATGALAAVVAIRVVARSGAGGWPRRRRKPAEATAPVPASPNPVDAIGTRSQRRGGGPKVPGPRQRIEYTGVTSEVESP